jgi:predicted transposase YdaD
VQNTNTSNPQNTSERFLDDISERLAYLNREMTLSDEFTNQECAIEKGIAIGHEKGLAEGIEKGIEKGLAEVQLKTRIEIISAMVEDGMDDERISRITKEPLEEITRIRKEFMNQKS